MVEPQDSEIIILVAASSVEEARKIGTMVVESRLAACANIIPHVESIFQWQGKVNHEEEALILFKTSKDLFDAVEQKVRENHSYSVPEVIAVPLIRSSAPYRDWLRGEIRK